MLQVCDGPACRLRARDLGLVTDAGARTGCLGQCDAPVAARAPATPRLLAIGRRGFGPEPVTAPGAQRGPDEPVLLRDVFFADQGELTAARRRGAYRALGALDVDAARALTRLCDLGEAAAAEWVLVDAAPATAGDFAVRPLGERDPHLVLEGACLAARALGAARAVVRVRDGWPLAAAALAGAASSARASGASGEILVAIVPAAPDEHHGEFMGSIDGALVLGAAQAARLARAAAVALQGADLDDGLGRAHRWWGEHQSRLCAVSGDVARPGVYELGARGTVAGAIAAAGGVVDGVRTAALGAALADGALVRQGGRVAPSALVVFHAGRDLDALG